jgi:hypothetical protein
MPRTLLIAFNGFLSALITLTTLLMGGMSGARAQVTRVDRITVSDVGIFATEEPTVRNDPTISTGEALTANITKVLEQATSIPAKLGTNFGVQGTLIGAPRGAAVELKIVWNYPTPGIRKPETGEYKTKEQYFENKNIGDPFAFFWTLGGEYTLIPGQWSLEL